MEGSFHFHLMEVTFYSHANQKKPADQQINTLWVVNTKSSNPTPIWLNAANVIHFAAWIPNATNSVAYSTVEPRSTAPGWQANNDLYKVTIGGHPNRSWMPTAVAYMDGGVCHSPSHWTDAWLMPARWYRSGESGWRISFSIIGYNSTPDSQ